MKHLFYILPMALILCVFCKKNNSPAPTPTPSPATADTTRPVIVITGNVFDTVLVGATYTDPGATASDNVDGNISAQIVVSGTANTTAAGNFTLNYNVSDQAGNQAHQKHRFVNVKPLSLGDTTRPVIVVLGNIFDTVLVGASYQDAGATATDNKDGNITSKIVMTGAVNTAAPANFKLNYNVSDQAGNQAHQKNRFVNVKPMPLTLAGNYSVACNCATLDPGVSAPIVANSSYTAFATVSSSNPNMFSLSAMRIGSVTPGAAYMDTNGGNTFGLSSVNVGSPGLQMASGMGVVNGGVINAAKTSMTVTTDFRIIMYPNMAYTCTNVYTKF